MMLMGAKLRVPHRVQKDRYRPGHRDADSTRPSSVKASPPTSKPSANAMSTTEVPICEEVSRAHICQKSKDENYSRRLHDYFLSNRQMRAAFGRVMYYCMQLICLASSPWISVGSLRRGLLRAPASSAALPLVAAPARRLPSLLARQRPQPPAEPVNTAEARLMA